MNKIKVIILIISVGLLLQSCASSNSQCAAYASNKELNNYEENQTKIYALCYANNHLWVRIRNIWSYSIYIYNNNERIMRKLTTSVATLLITINGFATNPDTIKVSNKDLIKEITITTEDIISWVKEDEWNGRMMTKELADIYVKELLNILSKIEDLKLKE